MFKIFHLASNLTSEVKVYVGKKLVIWTNNIEEKNHSDYSKYPSIQTDSDIRTDLIVKEGMTES